MVGCLHKRENGSFYSEVPELVPKLKRFTPTKSLLSPSQRVEITFLEDSLKFRGTVNMLVVTGLNDSIFGRIWRHLMYNFNLKDISK